MADLTAQQAVNIDTSGGPLFSLYGIGTRIREAEVSVTAAEAQIVRLLAEGTLGVPLETFRELASDDIPTLATAIAGTLGNDTSPALKRVNAGTNHCMKIDWASGDSDKVVASVPLPENLDTSASMVVQLRLTKSATGGDTSPITVITTFNEQSAQTSTVLTPVSTVANGEHTITGGTVPAGAFNLNIELGIANNTDKAVAVSGCRVLYARTLT